MPAFTPQKILIVITKSNFGGAQRYVYDLATALTQAGHEVVVAFGGHGVLAQKLAEAHIRTAPLDALGRDVNPLADTQTFFSLLHLFRQEHPHVVHLNSSKIGGLGCLAARLAGVPRIIFTAHGWAFNESRGRMQKAVIRFIYWLTMLLAHHTIIVSRAMRDQVVSWPFLEGRSSVIYNGIPATPLLPRTDARQELTNHAPTLATRAHTLWIGTVAELHPIKGYAYAIDAVASLARAGVPLTYIIVGDGEERDLIDAQIARLGVENTVIRTGFVPDAARLFAAFDIFLLASLSEGLNYTLIEAGAAGLPIVATRVGGIPEVVDTAGLLVPPRDTHALSDALQTLTTNETLRTHLGEALHRRIETTFALPRMLAETLRVYRRD